MSPTCPICHKTFARSHGVKQHIQGIHGPDIKCPIPSCTFTSKWERNMRRHLANVKKHPESRPAQGRPAFRLEDVPGNLIDGCIRKVQLSRTDNELENVPEPMPSYQTLLSAYLSKTMMTSCANCTQVGGSLPGLETRPREPQSNPRVVFTPQHQSPTSLAEYNVNENIRPGSYNIEPLATGDTGKTMWDNGSVWGVCMHGVLAEECSICLWGWA